MIYDNLFNYKQEEVIKLFESRANEAREEMKKLNEIEKKISMPEIIEKSPQIETQKPKENEEKKSEKPVTETLPTTNQNQAIEDWLDDLIIE